jgi:hypothetical protein
MTIGMDVLTGQGRGAYSQRPTQREPRPLVSTDAQRLAGQRLKAFIEDAMAKAGVRSLVELSDRAPVSYDTLHAWFRGRAPTPKPGGRVASVLGLTYSDLLAVYEGEERGGRFVRDDEIAAIARQTMTGKDRPDGLRDGVAKFDLQGNG